jgi:hypothetical protein
MECSPRGMRVGSFDFTWNELARKLAIRRLGQLEMFP